MASALRSKPDWMVEMRYPSLTLGQVDALAAERAKGLEPACDNVAVWRGEGETIALEPLDVVLAEFRRQLEKRGTNPSLTSDKEPFEGELAVAVFAVLDDIPVEVLDDPGFWRYLAMSRFWWFIAWREHESLAAGGVSTYVDGRRNTESIPLRLYLRAKSVADSNNPHIAAELKKCADFWRSHVTRVRTGSAPHLAAAFAAMQKDTSLRLPTKELRIFARRLNRLWSNVQLSVYGEVEAAAVIKELRS